MHYKRFSVILIALLLWTGINAIERSNGVYQIGTSADLLEFAQIVNAGAYDASAVLTADIDYSSQQTTISDGTTPGSQKKAYQGVFDGNGHTITLALRKQGDALALFSQIGEKGIVRNLVIDGSLRGTTGMGTIVWESWGTIENCIAKASLVSTATGCCTSGGIACACYAHSSLRNCIFTGSFEGEASDGWGGLIGWAHAYPVNIENCAVAASHININEADSYTFSNHPGTLLLSNCYYISKIGSVSDKEGSLLSKESLTNGELCFRLNGEQKTVFWKQTLGEDDMPYPFGSHKQVYAKGVDCSGRDLGKARYSNAVFRIPSHKYKGIKCEKCGKIKNTKMSDAATVTNFYVDTSDTTSFSSYVFGHNLEHTRAAINEGLSAQMLQNRKFAGKPSRNEGISSRWFGIGKENAFFLHNGSYTRHARPGSMNRYGELNSQGVQNLRQGERVGIGQKCLHLVKDKTYEMRVVTKVSAPTHLAIELSDRSGKVIYAHHALQLQPSKDWTTSEFTLTASSSDEEGQIQYTFTDAAEVTFGAVSMLPEGHFHGMRPDVVALLKAIGPSVIRWPGGNFAGEYRWEDGLLPVDQRGPLQSYTEIETQPYSDGYDHHEINTDDFIALCREVGAEPFITINPVWGTPEENANWVEYCNGSQETKYGKIRAERGFPEPYNVRFWSLGNEMGYNHMEGPKSPTGYAEMAGKQADALLKTDPSIELWSSGLYPRRDWAQNSAAVLADKARYVSLHNYTSPGPGHNYTTEKATKDTYNSIVNCWKSDLQKASTMRNFLDSTGKKLHISFDEWNQWYAWYRPSCVGEGIYAARVLHVFITESNALDMPICCYFQPVGEGAILIEPNSSRLTADGQMFAMMKEHKGGELCKIDGNDDYLATATIKEGVLTLTLINPGYDTDHEFNFNIMGKCQDATLYSSSSVKPNSYFCESKLEVNNKEDLYSTVLPPHSAAIVKIRLGKK